MNRRWFLRFGSCSAIERTGYFLEKVNNEPIKNYSAFKTKHCNNCTNSVSDVRYSRWRWIRLASRCSGGCRTSPWRNPPRLEVRWCRSGQETLDGIPACLLLSSVHRRFWIRFLESTLRYPYQNHSLDDFVHVLQVHSSSVSSLHHTDVVNRLFSSSPVWPM